MFQKDQTLLASPFLSINKGKILLLSFPWHRAQYEVEEVDKDTENTHYFNKYLKGQTQTLE
jgi:hypothetical protein